MVWPPATAGHATGWAAGSGFPGDGEGGFAIGGGGAGVSSAAIFAVHELLEVRVVRPLAELPGGPDALPADEVVQEVLPPRPLPQLERLRLVVEHQERPLEQREQDRVRHHLLLPLLVERQGRVVVGDVQDVQVVVLEGDLLVLEEPVVQLVVDLVLVRQPVPLLDLEVLDQGQRAGDAQRDVVDDLGNIFHGLHGRPLPHCGFKIR